MNGFQVSHPSPYPTSETTPLQATQPQPVTTRVSQGLFWMLKVPKIALWEIGELGRVRQVGSQVGDVGEKAEVYA